MFQGGPRIRTSIFDTIRQASPTVRLRLVALRVVLGGFQGVLGVGL